jgi:hypothetical protein
MDKKYLWPVTAVVCAAILGLGLFFGLGGGTDAQNSSPESYNRNTGTEASVDVVYVTRTGACYHRGSCRYLSKSKIPKDRAEAKTAYRPCSKCNP